MTHARRSVRLSAAALLVAALCLPAAGASAGQTVPCAECGMQALLTGRFTARLIQGKETRYFCDIGDLVVYLTRTKPAAFQAEVRDFRGGDWCDARTAFYAQNKELFHTPMGWGIAAFMKREAAPGPVMNFESLRKALP